MERGLMLPVVAGLAIGIAFVVVISLANYSSGTDSSQAASVVLDQYQGANSNQAGSSNTVYVFLFKVDRSLQNQNLLERLPSLYYQVQNMTGIQEPSPQAMQFTVTKQGIYDPTGAYVNGLPPAKIVVSSAITLPDGTKVTEDKIAQNATFYVTPIGPATLFMEDSGKFFAYHRDYYPNPKNISSDRTVTTIQFTVAGSDYERFNSKYAEIKNLVESLKP